MGKSLLSWKLDDVGRRGRGVVSHFREGLARWSVSTSEAKGGIKDVCWDRGGVFKIRESLASKQVARFLAGRVR